ncbi:hypothetical protein Cdeb_01453 [Caldibacillus debilis GB1]|jgi:hypothetical protein|uniref:Uncharacterized protein n=1 Tax=Caldibacillus debilis GB1 TaxID=1339248 RepID=A0A420VDU3_9BACI|nr:hypothetical protein Cdeb_01453 [Caldibacillus debilis GB1]
MASHTVPHSVKPVIRRQAVYGAGMSETSIGIGRIRNGPGPLGIGTGQGVRSIGGDRNHSRLL